MIPEHSPVCEICQSHPVKLLGVSHAGEKWDLCKRCHRQLKKLRKSRPDADGQKQLPFPSK